MAFFTSPNNQRDANDTKEEHEHATKLVFVEARTCGIKCTMKRCTNTLTHTLEYIGNTFQYRITFFRDRCLVQLNDDGFRHFKLFNTVLRIDGFFE
jgi:hypothetical protein